jgi:hypothetical protein
LAHLKVCPSLLSFEIFEVEGEGEDVGVGDGWVTGVTGVVVVVVGELLLPQPASMEAAAAVPAPARNVRRDRAFYKIV